jgi:hypothetical protein
MAGEQSRKYKTIDEVLQEVVRHDAGKRDGSKRIRDALCTMAEELELDSDFFVSAGLKILLPISQLAQNPNRHAAEILAGSTINAPAIVSA